MRHVMPGTGDDGRDVAGCGRAAAADDDVGGDRAWSACPEDGWGAFGQADPYSGVAGGVPWDAGAPAAETATMRAPGHAAAPGHGDASAAAATDGHPRTGGGSRIVAAVAGAAVALILAAGAGFWFLAGGRGAGGDISVDSAAAMDPSDAAEATETSEARVDPANDDGESTATTSAIAHPPAEDHVVRGTPSRSWDGGGWIDSAARCGGDEFLYLIETERYLVAQCIEDGRTYYAGAAKGDSRDMRLWSSETSGGWHRAENPGSSEAVVYWTHPEHGLHVAVDGDEEPLVQEDAVAVVIAAPDG